MVSGNVWVAAVWAFVISAESLFQDLRRLRRFKRDLVEKAGDALQGFRVSAKSFEDGRITWRATGTVERVPVEISQESETGDYEISLHGLKIPQSIRIERELETEEGQDIQTGHRTFDHEVRIVAESRLWMLAVLGPETRAAFLPLIVDNGVRVVDGRVYCKAYQVTQIREVIQEVLRGTKGLVLASEDVPKRLLENFKRENRAQARIRLLIAMACEAPGTAVLGEAVRVALRDEDNGVRLLASLLGNPPDWDILEQIWVKLGNIENLLLAMNLAFRDRPMGRDVIVQALIGALKADSQEIRLTAIGLLGKERNPSALAPLLGLGSETEDKKELEAICASVGLIGGPPVEPFLLKIIQDRSSDPPISAIKALGETGGWAAVGVLVDLSNKFSQKLGSDFWSHSYNVRYEVSVEGDRAIALIRSRMAPSQAGAVSVAGTSETEGGISLSNSGGELSDGGEGDPR